MEKTILVGIITKDQTYEKSIDYLEELAFLTETAGGIVDKIFTQKLINPNPKTFIGQGKINEICDYVKDNKIMTVIFDDELSATQERNISKIFNCKILDRTNLILDIFAQRAKTSYAKTQVELAQCEYLLPRLKGMWTHLERQKGGIGMRGPGETEIETDRRIVRNKISLLKNKIKSIDKQMHVQRGNRGKLVRVAIVGYTNVGKSTLMNVFAEDKLFATLDTTVRKLVIRNLPFLISDTVGFIRKLPTQLVESFKSTLDEVREADLFLHIVDITHSNFEEHKESVEKILSEIESINKPTILVFNKIDNYTAQKIEKDDLTTKKTKIHYSLQDWKSTWMSKLGDKVIFISAKSKINIHELKKVLYSNVREIHVKRFPYNHFLFPDFDEK